VTGTATSRETPALRVEGLAKKFGRVRVAGDLSFSVFAGEALGVIGPNGAGKTSLLNLIAGDVRPDSGSVWLGRDEVSHLSANLRCRRGVGRTAQVPRPFGGLTVYENVLVGAINGANLRGRSATNRATSALRQVKLLDRANASAGDLTLLQLKRLELARALATEPTVLLLDEIAGGLTDAEVGDLVDTVIAIKNSDVAIVWIEHVVHALVRSVDRILALDAGKALIEGPPRTVMASPVVRTTYLGEAS